MTPKQEREWVKGIYDQIRADTVDCGVILVGETLGLLREFSENSPICDKPFARKIAELYECILWYRQVQKGEMTQEEYFKRLQDKGKAIAEKRWNAAMARIKAKPRRRKRKKKL